MDPALRQVIQAALNIERPRQEVTQDPAFSQAINDLAQATNSIRQEIIWRALRMYFLAYLHAHETGTAAKQDLATRRG